MEQLLIANHKGALGQTSKLLVDALDSFHNQGTRRSAEHLTIGESMNMRVIPVKAWRFVRRNSKTIFVRFIVWLDKGVKHIVFVALGRYGHTVKVQVGGESGHAGVRAR